MIGSAQLCAGSRQLLSRQLEDVAAGAPVRGDRGRRRNGEGQGHESDEDEPTDLHARIVVGSEAERPCPEGWTELPEEAGSGEVSRRDYSEPVSYDPYAPREAEEPPHDYSPVKRGPTLREIVRRLFAPIVALGLLLLKFGAFAIKFFGIFISVAGYALIWGWPFAAGFVLLILVHEAGHFFEAKRQGLNPSLPVFLPFLGAYVAMKNAPFDP